MAISPDALAKIIGHNASTLCSPQGEKMISSTQRKKPIDMNPNEYSDEWDNFSLGADDTSIPKVPTRSITDNYTNESVMKSNLPDIIKESLMSKKITPTDSMSYITEKVTATKPQPSASVATITPQPQQFDYSIIKAIFNDCLKEYFSQNPISTEKKGKDSTSIAYSQSTNKIRVIHENGDIYAAKLTYQGNVNDKKS